MLERDLVTTDVFTFTIRTRTLSLLFLLLDSASSKSLSCEACLHCSGTAEHVRGFVQEGMGLSMTQSSQWPHASCTLPGWSGQQQQLEGLCLDLLHGSGNHPQAVASFLCPGWRSVELLASRQSQPHLGFSPSSLQPRKRWPTAPCNFNKCLHLFITGWGRPTEGTKAPKPQRKKIKNLGHITIQNLEP